MRTWIIILFTVMLLVVAALASPYVIDDEDIVDEYSGRVGSFPMDKRSCIRRGSGCDGKVNDCCPNSTCRCNLWGTNCKCERAGLFQKWGK